MCLPNTGALDSVLLICVDQVTYRAGLSGQSRLTGCLAAAPCSNPGASESLRGERGVSYCFELGDLASTYRAKTGQHLLSARSTGRGSRGPFDSLALPASAVSKTSGIARSWTGDLPISGWAALAKNGTRAAAEVCPGRRSALALAATVAGCGALEGPAAAPGSVVDVLLVWSLSLMAVVVSWKAVIAHLRPTPGLSCRLCRFDNSYSMNTNTRYYPSLEIRRCRFSRRSRAL